MKYLIVGLGNIGEEYENTRHNIGFKVLDALARASSASFTTDRYGSIGNISHKGRKLILLKPSTYMNLSGKAVNFWLQKQGIPIERCLIITDDLALPFSKIRLKPKGSDGGHNGLKSVQDVLNTSQYPRLRFGIGAEFSKGKQVNYVLGQWSNEEQVAMGPAIAKSMNAVLDFVSIGIERAMNAHNKK